MAIRRNNAAIAACLDALGDEKFALEGIVARRHNSKICRASSSGRTIAIKECFRPATLTPDPSAAEREFAALNAVARAATPWNQRPIVPLPLVLCREYGVYAMTWVAGRPATELVLAHSTRLDGAFALGEAAGEWLRRFHACRALPLRQGDFKTKLGFVNQLEQTSGGREPMVLRAAGLLAELASNAAAQPMPASWVHGDMKSDNLLVDGDHVTGLDVQLADENTVAYDLAPFLNHLFLLRWSPRGLYQRQKLDRMATGFMRAYSPDAEKWQLPLLWLRTYLLVQIVAPSTKSTRLHAVAAGWPARRELARAIDQLEKSR